MEPTSGLEPLTCGRLAPPGSVWGSGGASRLGWGRVPRADAATRTADLRATASPDSVWGSRGASRLGWGLGKWSRRADSNR